VSGTRLVAAGLTALVALSGCAEKTEIAATDPWIAEAPPGAKVMAGYLRLHNRSREALRCAGVSGADFGAGEIHRTVVEDGRSRMLRAQQIEVAAGGSIDLAPGGLHLMLFRPQREMPSGTRTTLVLDCGAHKPSIEFIVRPRT
jgi:periplasmic copper chaperone A